jgi:hypothetical protein
VRAIPFRRMAMQVTTIGPLQVEVRLEDGNIVHAQVLAFRWNDTTPDVIAGYLALVRAGHPNELRWVMADDIQRFR